MKGEPDEAHVAICVDHFVNLLVILTDFRKIVNPLHAGFKPMCVLFYIGMKLQEATC